MRPHLQHFGSDVVRAELEIVERVIKKRPITALEEAITREVLFRLLDPEVPLDAVCLETKFDVGICEINAEPATTDLDWELGDRLRRRNPSQDRPQHRLHT